MRRIILLSALLILAVVLPLPSGAATADLQVASGDNDADQKFSNGLMDVVGSVNSIRSSSDIDYAFWAGFRFTGSLPPKGSTITNAYASFRTEWVADVNAEFYFQKAASPAAFSVNNNDISARPMTTVFYNWAADAVGLNTWVAMPLNSLNAVLQELVDDNNYDATALVLIVKPKTTVGKSLATYSFESNATYGAKLHIEYTAPAVADTAPPALSAGSPSGALPAGTTQATISVTATDSTLPVVCRYSSGADADFSAMAGTMSNTSGTTHAATVTGLTDGTTYNYYVRCQDSVSPPNTNTSGLPIAFSVAVPVPQDTTPPVISNVQATNITTNSAAITWTTDDQSNSTVNYGLTESFGSTQTNSSLVANHSINLTGLAGNTAYYYQVRSCNSDNYCATSPTNTFTTQTPVGNNGTTVGTLELVPAFEQISVYSNFSGDDNANNQAVLEYRKVGAAQWEPGIPMTADRRAQISWYSESVLGTGYVPNPYKNQWRAIVFWLNENTDYEVRVTYADTDGLSGNPVTATIKTRNSNPVSSGTTYYVSPSGNDTNNGLSTLAAFKTIQKAANAVQAGDKVLVMPGTYNELVTITTSGTANNYITFQSYDLNDKAIIDGGGILQYNITVNSADFIRIKGFKTQNVNFANIRIYNGADDAIVEDNITDNPGTQWASAGIQITAGSAPVMRALVQRNRVLWSSQSPGVNRTEGTGIYFWDSGGGGHVLRNNYVDGNGAFKDCTGGTPNNSGTTGTMTKDSFVYNNECYGYWDDGYEVEGVNILNAVFSNYSRNTAWLGTTQGKQGMATAPVTIGPIYVFRNTFVDFTDTGYKIGGSSAGVAYIYHNTWYTATGSGVSHFGNDNKVDSFIFRNNIFKVGGRAIYAYAWPTTNNFDYDDMYTGSSYFARWYDANLSEGQIRSGGFEAFKTWTCQTNSLGQSSGCQEVHGIGDNPTATFVDAANNNFQLQSTSPNIDKGVVLVGFNDQNSPWPYKGSAPDIGAYEYDSGAPPPPSSFTVSATNLLYLFRDKTNLLQITGSNFNLSTNFTVQFLQNSSVISSFTSQPTNSTNLEISLTSAQINTLPIGFYDLKIVRTTDSTAQTYTKQILVTALGDLWSSTATESSEQKRDGKVNTYDFSRMFSKWGSTASADLQECDISSGPGNVSQGKIDLYDANKMMANWLP